MIKPTLLSSLLAGLGISLTAPTTGRLTPKGEGVPDLNAPACKSGLNRKERRARLYGKGRTRKAKTERIAKGEA